MLVARGRAEDRAEAATLIGAAPETAERLGMRGVAGQARALRARLDGPPVARCRGAHRSRRGQRLRARGRILGGALSRLGLPVRDRAGLAYLALLLERPHEDVPALTLTGGPRVAAKAAAQAGAKRDLGDGSPLRSGRGARRPHPGRYRERLQDLADEIEAAEQDHDTGRAERLRAESERLRDALAAALGLGGRARRAGSPAERARVRVRARAARGYRALRPPRRPGRASGAERPDRDLLLLRAAEPTAWSVGLDGT